jgi:hypothetical protein
VRLSYRGSVAERPGCSQNGQPEKSAWLWRAILRQAGTSFADRSGGISEPGFELYQHEAKHMMRSIEPYRSGKIGYILLWLLGVPIPILLLIFLLRGCT